MTSPHPFRDDLSSVGPYRLGLVMINMPIKFQVLKFTHYEDKTATQSVQIGVVWVVRGHPRWSTVTFDRAHMTSYSTSIETMSILNRVGVIATYCPNGLILIYPTCTRWVTRSNLTEIVGVRKLESLGYCAALIA